MALLLLPPHCIPASTVAWGNKDHRVPVVCCRRLFFQPTRSGGVHVHMSALPVRRKVAALASLSPQPLTREGLRSVRELFVSVYSSAAVKQQLFSLPSRDNTSRVRSLSGAPVEQRLPGANKNPTDIAFSSRLT